MYTINRQQFGISLIELIIFIVIVSIAVAGVLSVMDITTRHSADPMVRKQALAVAESLLEEIELQPFTWCDPHDANATTATSAAGCATLSEKLGPSTPDGESRYNAANPYNNVSNYNGFSMSPIVDITHTPITGLNNYSASVTVTPNTGTLSSASQLQINVTVTSGNTSIMLTGYRYRYAPNAAG